MSNKIVNIEKIANIIENNDVSLMDLRPYLEEVFPKKSIDFSFAGAAHFEIKSPEGTIMIVNKKYVDDADKIVGELAIGYV